MIIRYSLEEPKAANSQMMIEDEETKQARDKDRYAESGFSNRKKSRIDLDRSFTLVHDYFK